MRSLDTHWRCPLTSAIATFGIRIGTWKRLPHSWPISPALVSVLFREVHDDLDCTPCYGVLKRAPPRRKDGQPQYLRHLCLRLSTPLRVREQETEGRSFRPVPATTRRS